MAANKFKVARILDGRKQIEVAMEARIAPSVLSQIENGWLTPKPEQLKRLRRVLPKLDQVEALVR